MPACGFRYDREVATPTEPDGRSPASGELRVPAGLLMSLLEFSCAGDEEMVAPVFAYIACPRWRSVLTGRYPKGETYERPDNGAQIFEPRWPRYQ
jgi:hypothetical protein